MYVPIIPNVTVINKNIVYTDTILPLKDIGSNLVVTKVNNVKEYDLERCLSIIFKENSNVVFNTVQYSKENETIYLYTNGKINVSLYKESNYHKYSPITYQSKILEEIKNILGNDDNNDYNCISLYNVSILLKDLYNEYENIKLNYDNKLNYIIHNNYSSDCVISLCNFDFEDKILKIDFKRDWNYDRYWTEVYLKKHNDDLFITKSTYSLYTDDIFNILSSELSIIYDKLLTYTDYQDYKNSKHNIHPVNSTFNVDIDNYGVVIKIGRLIYKNDLEISSLSYKQNYKIKCNSNIVKEGIIGSEDEIFKRIYVNISDCPIWCQEKLLNIRKQELDIKLEQEEYLKNKELKKQKRLALVKKVFPFVK